MPEFPKLPIIDPPGRPSFPELPIVTPDPPRLTLAEKYGSLYYLGIGGLILTLAMVGNFAYQIWKTRDLWAAVFVLGNEYRPMPERVRAAWAMAHHPAALDAQKVELAFNKDLPDLVRYIVAEGLTPDAIRADPKAYALQVARSEGWPNWLRLVLTRPMAYGVGEGYRIAWEPLDQLRQNGDQAIVLWATYTRAVMGPGDLPASAALAAAAQKAGFFQPLAALLDQAAKAEGPARTKKLDEATAWLREHHPIVAEIWKGWEVRDGKLVQKSPTPAP